MPGKKYAVLVALLFIFGASFLSSSQAAFTGIALAIHDEESDWKIRSTAFPARIRKVTLSAEEKTTGGLRVGGFLGELSLRLDDASALPGRKFGAQFIGFYLRLPYQINPIISVHNRFSYAYHSGNEELPETEIEWYDARLFFGISALINNVRLMPFIQYQSIDGDISSETSTDSLKLRENASQGINLDYYTGASSYIRFQATSGGNEGFMLQFTREY